MFNLIQTIMTAIFASNAAPVVTVAEPVVELMPLELDAFGFARDVLTDGTIDAMNSDDQFVIGWFNTMSGRDLRVEISYLAELNETVYVIGQEFVGEFKVVTTTEFNVALQTMLDYLLIGA